MMVVAAINVIYYYDGTIKKKRLSAGQVTTECILTVFAPRLLSVTVIFNLASYWTRNEFLTFKT